ncbi:MAG TPA: SMC-Scp complex subunit ScpB [Alphaproteobacteria bacterium]|nr:SMC-Scp complex subunit ScpB [Alphaproteobacteria bacterium]
MVISIAKKSKPHADHPVKAKKEHKSESVKLDKHDSAPKTSALENSQLKNIENKLMEKIDSNPEVVISNHHKTDNSEIKGFVDKTDPKTDSKLKVEALLFAVGKYLDEETISKLCEIDLRITRKALNDLKSDYDSRNTALMVVQEGESWKINVREKYVSLVRKIVADTELSKSIMETLAVIAWKTPVYQNTVVKIRGNKCYDHIEELVNAGFVTKDKKGRSFVLKTTEKFYNYFDIDQKNLKGVMGEAKMPVKQSTLTDMNDKPEEVVYSREKLIEKLEGLETKSIHRTEEEKNAEKEFLDRIHSKIEQSAKKTDEVVSEIPRPMHEQPVAPEGVEIQEISNDAVIEKGEDIQVNTDTPGEHHFQKPGEQPKVKPMTKKQLEKKFKDELLRVRDKDKK